MAGPFQHGAFGAPAPVDEPIVQAVSEERHWMIDPDGRARTLPARQLERAQSEGWRPAENPDEIAKAQEYERVRDEATQGFTGQANAFVEGVARAIPGADYIARKGNELLLGEEQADLINEAVKARSTTGAALTGEVLGNVGLALGTGGASSTGLLAKIASKNPVALINRGAEAAGLAAEKLVTRVAPGTIGRILAKGTALGTEGALQGMAVQVGHNINEAALGDEELAAEKLWAGVPEAMAWGGGIGAALGIPIGAVKAAGTKLASVAERGVAGVKSPGILDKAIDKFADASAFVSGKSADDIKSALKKSNVRLDAVNYEPLKQKAVQEAVTGLDAIQRLEKVERQLAAGEFKAENVAKFVKRDPQTVLRAASKLDELDNATRALDPVISSVGKRAKKVASEAAEELGPQNAAAVRKIIDSGKVRVAKAIESGADKEAETFLALEEMNRGFANLSKNAQNALAHGAGGDPLKIAQTRKLFELTEQTRRDVRTFLEDSDTWGQAAVNQQKRNAAIHEYLNTKTDFDNKFFVRTGERGDDQMWALKKKEADAGKIDQYMTSLDDWRKNKSHEQTIRHLDAKENLLKTLEEIGEIPPSLAKQFSEARAANQSFRAAIHTQAERLGNANMVRKLAQTEEPMGGFAAAAMGSMLGGPVGAAAGFAFNALANPGRIVNKVIQIEALAQQIGRFDRSAAKSMQSFVRGAGDRAAQALPRAQRIASAARRTATGQVSASSPDYTRRAKQIQQMASDPELAIAAVSRVTDGLDRTAPKLAQALTATHQNTLNYLNSLIPKPPASVRYPAQREAWKPPPAEIIKFERAYRAIVDPLSVLADLRAGTVTMDAVNALKATRPKMWADLRGVAMTTVAAHPDQLDYAATVRLSLMFDFAGDPTLEPGFLSRHQAMAAAAPEGTEPAEQQQAPGGTNIPGFSNAVQTHTEKVAAAL
jgi:hypothetical protein